MPTKSYGLICPISKACELLTPRWTIHILVELAQGYTRFSDLRRVLGNVSPAILSTRLAELEAAGMVERVEDRARGTVDYLRTAKAEALDPALDALAIWAQQNIEAELAVCSFDLSQFMWNLRAVVDTDELPQRRVVVRMHFTDEEGPFPVYWLVYEPSGDTVEACIDVPAFEVDLFMETTKVSLGAALFGRSTYAREIAEGRLFLSSDAVLERTIDRWLPQSPLAGVEGTLQQAAAG